MKDAIGLIVCLAVYSMSIFGLGLFIQMKADQWQLKKFTDASWRKGCVMCAEFEQNACARDQLQGVPPTPRRRNYK